MRARPVKEHDPDPPGEDGAVEPQHRELEGIFVEAQSRDRRLDHDEGEDNSHQRQRGEQRESICGGRQGEVE